ncbi:MAG TPA: polysaccharide biosynthesis protein, partial [Sphingobacteriaceae bacterium]
LIVAAVIPAFFAALSDSILEMPPRLHQDIRPLQRNQAEVSIGRLLLSALVLSVFPFTWLALLASSVPRIYGNFRLRRISGQFAAPAAAPDAEVRKEVVKGVSRTLPIVIYHCISGQIAIWLVSILGTTANVSELGALGRIAILFNVFTVLFSTLIVPRFSRMENRRGALLRSFALIQGVLVLVSLGLMLGVWIFSGQILWVLGDQYAGLTTELLLMGLLSCSGLLAGISSQLVISRGWFIRPYYLIGINFSATVLSLTVFQIRTLTDILYFNTILTAISYLLALGYGLHSIYRKTEAGGDPQPSISTP